MQVFDRKGLFCCNSGFPGAQGLGRMSRQTNGCGVCKAFGCRHLRRPLAAGHVEVSDAPGMQAAGQSTLPIRLPSLTVVPSVPADAIAPAAASAAKRRSSRKHHETHLSAVQSPPRPHAWVPCAHEDARWSRRHQRPPRQGSQAPRSLRPRRGAGNDRPPAAQVRFRTPACRACLFAECSLRRASFARAPQPTRFA